MQVRFCEQGGVAGAIIGVVDSRECRDEEDQVHL